MSRMQPRRMPLAVLFLALPAVAGADPGAAAAQPIRVDPPAIPEQPALDPVEAAAADDPSLRQPARSAQAPPVVTPQTLAYREHRRSLARARFTLDHEGIRGGLAVIGIQLGTVSPPDETGQPVDPLLSESFKGWDGYGAPVAGVPRGTPADIVGIQPGDVVVKFAGLWVDSQQTLQRLVSRSDVTREYEIEYLRGDQVYRAWIMPVPRSELEGFELPRR